jgi:hypothetical protein
MTLLDRGPYLLPYKYVCTSNKTMNETLRATRRGGRRRRRR